MSVKLSKTSVVISLILTLLLFTALLFVTYWLPDVVTSMINAEDNLGNRENVTDLDRGLILADAYAMLAVAYLAVALLYLLLRTILHGKVFGKKTVRLLSAISWCCFAEGALVILLTFWFQLAAVAALAACFVGLCLRVVKNVIEEATRIKAENDFTI